MHHRFFLGAVLRWFKPFWEDRGSRMATLAGLGLWLIFWFSVPSTLFHARNSAVLEDATGELLSARIAPDGQWRFPAPDSLPSKYIAAVVTFEDQRFFQHGGIDALAVVRAIGQNLRAGRVVSGGSTISMQVMRLAGNGGSRSVLRKGWEAIQAIRLELRYSKAEILRLYAAHAPFGGNVVGIEAAAWRYFGKGPQLLSWGEAALLAVLPNNPGLLHPGRNRSQLLAKRNRLLDRLAVAGYLDAIDLDLAKAELIPEAPLQLPRLAPHLLDRLAATTTAGRWGSSLQIDLQRAAESIVHRQHQLLVQQEIHNVAALIVHVPTGKVLAYIGNAPAAGAAHGASVDITIAPRSTGSILKPFLFALALQDGLLLPGSWLPDVPLNINGYRPENFDHGYDGLVGAGEALSRSLNVPFVELLRRYDIARFHRQLGKLGLRTLNQGPSHYGLSLILGGAEASLWDITGMYSSMARTLTRFTQHNSRYSPADWHPLQWAAAVPYEASGEEQRDAPLLSAGAIWATFNAMQEVRRPNSEGEWERFAGSRRVAWKTGTSFGFRDAWAVGLTPEYAVGVWVGNADGEGRPNLVGSRVAAPIMFELFSLLPPTSWFAAPYDDLAQTACCQESGWRAGPYCPVDSLLVPRSSQRAASCPYHQLIHLDPLGKYQVTTQCQAANTMLHQPWLVIPPLEEYYYRTRHPAYRALPPYREGCLPAAENAAIQPMQWIYPRQTTRILVPRDLDGSLSPTVFQVAHRNPDARIYWHLDQTYLGTTQFFHQFAFAPSPGRHLVTLVDEQGNRLEQWMEFSEGKK